MTAQSTYVQIRQAGIPELPLLAELFDRYVQNELPYQKLSADGFQDLFFTSSRSVTKLLYYAAADDRIIGFAAGCITEDTHNCFLTFILTDLPYRRQGVGGLLLQALETGISSLLPECGQEKKLTISFFNPCALTWTVPGTAGHDHPNAPGVDVASAAYLFFKNNGFRPVAYQNSFYLPLRQYTPPSSSDSETESLRQAGITLSLFDPKNHTGLKELAKDLGNPVWERELLSNAAKGAAADPLPAAIRQGRIVAFAGPLHVQESGRGYFAGIGVHSSCRNLGLGSLMFHTLCAALKDMGAGYMTLFTGETNPAGRIYKQAGFSIVKTWADMEKAL